MIFTFILNGRCDYFGFDFTTHNLIFPYTQVMAQLNACGVVETIRISAAGYPIR